jgi:hypothetical protein
VRVLQEYNEKNFLRALPMYELALEWELSVLADSDCTDSSFGACESHGQLETSTLRKKFVNNHVMNYNNYALCAAEAGWAQLALKLYVRGLTEMQRPRTRPLMVPTCALNIATNVQDLLGCIYELNKGAPASVHREVDRNFNAKWAALSVAVPWTPTELEGLMRKHVVPLRAAYQNAHACNLPAAFAAAGQVVIPNDQRIGEDATAKKFRDETMCRGCGSKARQGDVDATQKLLCCAGGKVARYCGVLCQANDWPKHRGWCRASVAAKKALKTKK